MARICFFARKIGAIISPRWDFLARFNSKNDFSGSETCANYYKENLAEFVRDFELSHIKPLERRRLSIASKCASTLFAEIQSSIESGGIESKNIESSEIQSQNTQDLKNTQSLENTAQPLIFSSYTGEINRCFFLLNEIKKGEAISPSSFSLSVLNATPALLAINSANHSEILAISANPALENAAITGFSKLKELQDRGLCGVAVIFSYYERLAKEIQKEADEFYMSAFEMSLDASFGGVKCEIDISSLDLINSIKNEENIASDFPFLCAIKALKSTQKPQKWEIVNDKMKFAWSIENAN